MPSVKSIASFFLLTRKLSKDIPDSFEKEVERYLRFFWKRSKKISSIFWRGSYQNTSRLSFDSFLIKEKLLLTSGSIILLYVQILNTFTVYLNCTSITVGLRNAVVNWN